MKTTRRPRRARLRAVCPASVASVRPGQASAGDSVLLRRCRALERSFRDSEARLPDSSEEDRNDDAMELDSALRHRAGLRQACGCAWAGVWGPPHSAATALERWKVTHALLAPGRA